jgi:preprotein translocase subunit YajC
MGDVIFQSVMLLIPILLIILVIYFIQSSRKRTKRLQSVEEKLDKLLEKK